MTAKCLSIPLSVLLCLILHCPVKCHAYETDLSALLPMVNEASTTFRAVTAEDVARAKESVQRQLLKLSGTIGTRQDWRDYLLWEQQLTEFNRAGPGTADLWRQVHDRVARDADLFEQDAFKQYRSTLRNLINCIEAHENADLEGDYQTVLSDLNEVLVSAGDKFSPADLSRVSHLLTKLQRQQQAAPLIAAIAKRAALPNFVIELPADTLARQRHVEETYSIRHSVRGLPVESSGTLVADHSSVLHARTDTIALMSVVNGVSASHSLGFGNGVTIRSSGTLTFTSTANLHVNLEGITAGGFATTGALEMEILGVSTKYRGRAAVRARQSVYSRREADRMAAERQSLEDLNATFATRLDDLISPLQAAYRRDFFLPLSRHDRLPKRSQFVSSADRATAKLWFADAVQLAAPTNPPWSSEPNGHFRLAIHESAMNNTSALLAGRVRSLVSVLNGRFFEYVADNAKPYERIDIRFDDEAAIRTTLRDGSLKVQLVGKEFINEGSTYPGMEIALHYRIEDEALPVLKLVERPKVVHYVSAGEDHARLGVRGIALRRILSNILQEHVPESLDLAGIRLPDAFSGNGKLRGQRIAITDGWLLIEALPETHSGQESGEQTTGKPDTKRNGESDP